jgi:hypothetical protein
MEASRLIGTLLAHRARFADIAGKDEPNSRQGDARLRRQAVDNALKGVVCGTGFPDAKRERLKVFEVHLRFSAD